MNRYPVASSLLLAVAVAVNHDCPHQANGCGGTAEERAEEAKRRARLVSLDAPWNEVREAVVDACGLQVQQSTSHCFQDFNHVDCCTMDSTQQHETNEASRVAGMHAVNYLGSHIVDASISERGPGGSWCTCQISSPEDVCHRQFGARTAFKLVWCRGTGFAALLDDYANVLSHGKPTSARGEPPAMGGARAREQSWRVLDESKNASWASRWRAACDEVQYGAKAEAAEAEEHDEL